MTLCIFAGKDKLIFVTEEDHSQPSSVVLPEDEDEEAEGLLKPNGEINWGCPCLQGMAYGPCGEQFKSAFSCFHYSEADPKGSDCIPAFREMQECFVKYPELYGRDEDELKDDSFEDIENEFGSGKDVSTEHKEENKDIGSGNTNWPANTDQNSKLETEQIKEFETQS